MQLEAILSQKSILVRIYADSQRFSEIPSATIENRFTARWLQMVVDRCRRLPTVDCSQW